MKSDDLLKKLPENTRETAGFIWDSLPTGERLTLEKILQGIPNETNLLRMLLNMGAAQLKLSFGDKSRVVIVGPANVGKSTLYNQFVQAKEDKAAVSALPGTTRVNQLADTGMFSLVDTPGADAVGAVGEAERQRALQAAGQADVIILMFDAIQGIKRTELELFHEISSLGKPFIVVLNKTDLVRKELPAILNQTAAALKLEPSQVIPIGAKDGQNLSQVVVALSVCEPGIVAALGRALPQYRWRLAWRSIVSAASVSAVIALTPLPVIDFVPLTITQASMVLGIARVYNYPLNLARSRELVAAFGAGLLGRTLFHELSRLGGPPGWVLAAAIAASTTAALGYAAAVWFERGEKLTSQEVKVISQNFVNLLLQRLKFKKKPDEKGLKAQVAAALEEIPLPSIRDTAADQENIPADHSDFTE